MALLMLLDGNSLTYRAFFALPTDLATASGQVTNAVYGFTSMLVNLIKDHKPDYLAVAFDRPEPTFRHELVEGYKATRSAAPDILRQQMGLVRQLVETMRVPVVEAPGYEADDVLATLATRAAAEGNDVIVVTGDRDTYQLVEDPHLKVLYNRRGVSDYALYDEAGILERTGVTPAQYPDFASLRGDPSDNLPGIPGVGEKTAAKLLNTYGDLDGIYANLDALTPKLRENLAANENLARANAAVIPLVRDVPLETTVEGLDLGGWDFTTARDQFAELELRTLWRRMAALLEDGSLGQPAAGSDMPAREAAGVPGDLAAVAETTAAVVDGGEGPLGVLLVGPVDVELARTETPTDAVSALDELVTTAAGSALGLAGRWEGAPGRSPLRGLVAVAPHDDAFSGVWVPASLLGDVTLRAELSRLLSVHPVAGHHVKELLRSLLAIGVDCTSLEIDTAVAAYLLDPSTGDYSLTSVAGSSGEGSPTPAGQLALGTETVDVAESAATEAATVVRLAPPLEAALEAEGLAELHREVELPLVRVLARMEDVGIAVDQVELRRIADELIGDTKALEEEIQRQAGHAFNVNSTPQLRTVLYDELGLTPTRKTKTGYSTDAQTLETLRDEHPIVEALLRYREVEKLRSTYGEALLAEVALDGRIHASFRQTVARTGRLSSEQPNLHNIPVRTDAGRRFRRAFVPSAGASFLVADYDQVELRVLAHLSGDPGLLEAFTAGTDIHRAVASGIYGVEPAEVTREQRERAKMVSYGLAYGMEAFGLSRRLNAPVEEAQEIMDRYFRAFPEVRDYMEGTVAEARSRGYTRTLLGRKRPLPELNDSNYRVRQAAERQAMNAGIQGLAADLFKVALVRLDGALESAGLASRLVLQVHDEVIVDVPEGEEAAVGAMTEDALTHAVDLSLPLEVSMAWGDSWADAKGG